MSGPRSLRSNVAANVMTAASVLGTALLAVPLILDAVGTAGYGVWTLALTLILYVTTAEAGLGPAIQRYVAVASGAGRRDAARRLLWTSLALYSGIGLLALGLVQPLAPVLVDLFDVTAPLRADAEAMFRTVGAVLALALVAAAFGNVQQGLERFVSFAVSAAVGSVAYLALLAVLLGQDRGLRGVAEAALLQQAVMAAVRAVDLARALGAHLPRFASREQSRSLLGFAARLQATVLSQLVNSQTDRVVVGLVAPTATLGQLGIGGQVADAGRLLSGAALAPLVTRFSTAYGEGGAAALDPLFARLHRLWLLVVIGGTVIGAATIHPLLAGWLGSGYGKAALFGGLLVVAYGLNLLSGTGVAYLRATGRPSVEARYGGVLVVANLLLVIGLGVTVGATGAVAGTVAAYAIGTVWFFSRLRRQVPGHLLAVGAREVLRALALALVAGAVALGWGLLMIALLPAGISLVPIGLGCLVALLVYVAVSARVPLSLVGLRALV